MLGPDTTRTEKSNTCSIELDFKINIKYSALKVLSYFLLKQKDRITKIRSLIYLKSYLFLVPWFVINYNKIKNCKLKLIFCR